MVKVPVIRLNGDLWTKERLMSHTRKKFQLTTKMNEKINPVLTELGIDEYPFHNYLCDSAMARFNGRENVTLEELDTFLIHKCKEMLQYRKENFSKEDNIKKI